MGSATSHMEHALLRISPTSGVKSGCLQKATSKSSTRPLVAPRVIDPRMFNISFFSFTRRIHNFLIILFSYNSLLIDRHECRYPIFTFLVVN